VSAMMEELREKAMKTLHDAETAYAVTDITNTFSAFLWYLRSAEEEKAIDTLWSVRDDIVYVDDGRGYRGQRSVRAFLVDARKNLREEKLALLAQKYPGEYSKDSNMLGIGDYNMQWPANSYLRIADDNQTAKGVWWTPGLFSETDENKNLQAYMRVVNYGVEFVNEDGKWKIWHLREFPEFSFPVDQDTADLNAGSENTGAEYELRRRMDAHGVQSNLQGNYSGAYSPTKVPTGDYSLFEPYDTWEDRFSCTRNAEEGLK